MLSQVLEKLGVYVKPEHTESMCKVPTYKVTDDEIILIVTLDDISNGKQRSARSCPIALSANKVVGPMFVARMIYELNTWSINNPPEIQRYYSREARIWVNNFDNDRNSVAPERFVFKRILK